MVVTVIPASPAEAQATTVSDLLLGAGSLAGVFLAVALILGAVFGGAMVAFKRYFQSRSDQMPRVSPYDPDSPLPPS